MQTGGHIFGAGQQIGLHARGGGHGQGSQQSRLPQQLASIPAANMTTAIEAKNLLFITTPIVSVYKEINFNFLCDYFHAFWLC